MNLSERGFNFGDISIQGICGKDMTKFSELKLILTNPFKQYFTPGHIAQSVTCLATDASLTADPGVASSIQAWSQTVMD